ncbi:MAG: SIS domain-containing protein [Bacteroidetes bacterium]|nr:SIS domain-containing protein [Bacteroidota bacterium]
MTKKIISSITDSISTKQLFAEDKNNIILIKQAADLCIASFKNYGKVLLCGNGGSAADAQHIAAELSGRFNYDREPLYAEALHVNSSFVTAVANDYSYDDVFSRMIKAAGKSGDVLIGISTSGNSINVVNALTEAKKLGMFTVGLTGLSGGKIAEIADICIKVPSKNTARIQETHILIGHVICEEVESTLFPR